MKRILLIFPMLLSLSTFSQVGNSDFDITTVLTNLDTPWEILWGPDDKIWFTERKGTVKRVNPDTKAVETLLTINDVYENSETGLLGMALHPDFTTTKPWVYLVYTYQKSGAPNNGVVEKLVRYTYQNNQLVSPSVLIDDILGNTTHVGSRLLFLPDKTLLMTTGEAQDPPLAQNKSSLNGKILRLNEDGTAASGNPVNGSRMYSFGHRNPQGLTYGNSKIYSAEHGANDNDEINIIEPNNNYGWPTVRGYCDNQNTAETNFCNANDVTEPIWSSGNASTEAVAGLQYYPANGAITPLRNSLLMVSLKFTSSPQRGRDLRVLKLSTDGNSIASETTLLDNLYGRLRDLCISPSGDIYVSTSNQDGRGTPAATDDRILKLKYKFLSTSIESVETENSSLYPNPTTGILNIKYPEINEITLTNQVGQSFKFVVLNNKIDITSLENGIYMMKTPTSQVVKVIKH